MIQVKKLTIKKHNIEKLKKRYQWKGSGTQMDPIEITSTKDLPVVLKFKTKDLHVKISNIQHRQIKLKRCRNITIYNCRISYLELKSCWNVTVKDSDIKRIWLEHCKGNTFERNKISNLETLKKHNPKKIVDKKVLLFLILPIWPLIGFVFGILLYIILVHSFELFKLTLNQLVLLIFFTVLYGSITIVVLWGVVIDPLITNMRLKKLEPNKLNGNSLRVKGSGLVPNLIEKS